MEFFGFFFLFVLLVAAGIGLASTTTARTRHWTRGRGAFVLLAFFAPFLFVIYLATAGYLRNTYHRSRAEAFSFDGAYSLPLSHGYYLSFFDEMPQDSDLALSTWPFITNQSVSKIDRIAWNGSIVAGHIHDGATAEEVANPYFTLDTSNGVLRRFANEEKMRASVAGLVPLQAPDALFQEISSTQRSALFWPLVLIVPCAMVWVVAKIAKKKPA